MILNNVIKSTTEARKYKPYLEHRPLKSFLEYSAR